MNAGTIVVTGWNWLEIAALIVVALFTGFVYGRWPF